MAYNISLNIFFGLQCVIFFSILFQKNYFLLSSFVICFPRHHHFQQNFQQAHNSLMDSKACTLSLHHEHIPNMSMVHVFLWNQSNRGRALCSIGAWLAIHPPHPPPPSLLPFKGSWFSMWKDIVMGPTFENFHHLLSMRTSFIF